jgi:hypothetical protein
MRLITRSLFWLLLSAALTVIGSNLLELPPSRLDKELAGPPFYLSDGFRHLKRVQLPCLFILVSSFEDIPIAGSCGQFATDLQSRKNFCLDRSRDVFSRSSPR